MLQGQHFYGTTREEAAVLTRGFGHYFPEEEEFAEGFIRQMSAWVGRSEGAKQSKHRRTGE